MEAFVENVKKPLKAKKAYRKKDPAYADSSIQQQQHLLQRLSEEWSASECGGPPFTPEKKVVK
jgi:hypothetical protein